MTVHVLGRVVADIGAAEESREGVRETVGTVIGVPLVSNGRNAGKALLSATRVSCRQSGGTCSAIRCLDCQRFVNFRPSRDRQHVTIRCRWHSEDPVGLLMRPAAALVLAPPDCRVFEALQLAADYNLRYLLVVDDDLLCGIVDLERVGDAQRSRSLASVMSRRMWITFTSSTLGDAGRIMEDNHVDVLPVVEDARLAGMLTLDDLREAGLAD